MITSDGLSLVEVVNDLALDDVLGIEMLLVSRKKPGNVASERDAILVVHQGSKFLLTGTVKLKHIDPS